jgi:molybdopterin converting factor small subunit
MKVRVLAFARLRDLLGAREQVLELAENAAIADAWASLARACGDLEAERASTRAARNGELAPFSERLHDGDELAFLPPVGGG